MIRGKSFKLFVISTIMTHKETVARIEPPRKEAAPSRAYLEIHQTPVCMQNTSETRIQYPTNCHYEKDTGQTYSQMY